MSEEQDSRLRVGDPVRLKDSDMDLRGDVWQLRTGRYLVVRWQDECRRICDRKQRICRNWLCK